jgi:hypothetical protein
MYETTMEPTPSSPTIRGDLGHAGFADGLRLRRVTLLPAFRKPLLYPSELRGHGNFASIISRQFSGNSTTRRPDRGDRSVSPRAQADFPPCQEDAKNRREACTRSAREKAGDFNTFVTTLC